VRKATRNDSSLSGSFFQNRVAMPILGVIFLFLSFPLNLFFRIFRLVESRAIIAPLTVHWHDCKRDARCGKLDTGYDRAIKPIYVRISFRALARACDVDRAGSGDSPFPFPRTCRRSRSLWLRTFLFPFSPSHFLYYSSPFSQLP